MDREQSLPRATGDPFYQTVNEILETHGFDDFVEDLCTPHYAERTGAREFRPGRTSGCLC